MNPIAYILNKFSTVEYDEEEYVEVNPLVKLYKKISGKSRATFPEFVLDNNLDYLITNKKTDKVVNQVLSKDRKFTHQSYNIYVRPEDVAKIEAFVKILENEAKKDAKRNAKQEKEKDLTEEISQDKSAEESAPDILTKKDIQNLINQQYPIIDMTDEEKFTDADENIYEIEVRGERSKDKILFRASHMSEFLGMERLSKILQQEAYKYGQDYIILDADTINKQTSLHWQGGCQCKEESSWQCPGDGHLNEAIMNLKMEPSNKPKKIYLTLNGLLRMIFVSDSGNKNRDVLRDWVINLVYVHKFGSDIERLDLVETLKPYKKCLTKLSGIYLISIGKVKSLRDSMNISTELYPKKDFDNAHVFKYGRSEDIMNRYSQHVARTGYGKYSDKILMEWFVVIPTKLLSSAEADLGKYFKSNQLSFEFNDGSKAHDELIIVQPGVERQNIKDKYFDIIKCYLSDTNSLIKQMTEMKMQNENSLERIESASKINTLEHALEMSQLESKTALEMSQLRLDSSLKIQDLAHQVELLKLKLQLATR